MPAPENLQRNAFDSKVPHEVVLNIEQAQPRKGFDAADIFDFVVRQVQLDDLLA